MKLFKAATTPLSPEKFDGSPDKFFSFLENVAVQAKMHNWDPILRIPNNANTVRYLPKYINELTEDNIRAHAMTYILNDCRDSQRTTQLYYFLFNSLTETFKNQVSEESHRYMIDGQQDTYVCGTLYLKTITMLVCIDTTATLADIQNQLQTLDAYMRKSENSNVEKFNTYFRSLHTQLINRGETLPNTMLNISLFNGYEAASDSRFVNYISNLKEHPVQSTSPHTQ
jgi:hypothetical protein